MLGEVIGGLIILLLDIVAIVNVLRADMSPAARILWVVAILIFPVFGLIAWLLWGRADGPARSRELPPR